MKKKSTVLSKTKEKLDEALEALKVTQGKRDEYGQDLADLKNEIMTSYKILFGEGDITHRFYISSFNMDRPVMTAPAMLRAMVQEVFKLRNDFAREDEGTACQAEQISNLFHLVRVGMNDRTLLDESQTDSRIKVDLAEKGLYLPDGLKAFPKNDCNH